MCVHKQEQGMWLYTNQRIELQYDLWLVNSAVAAGGPGKTDISGGQTISCSKC